MFFNIGEVFATYARWQMVGNLLSVRGYLKNVAQMHVQTVAVRIAMSSMLPPLEYSRGIMSRSN
jgi:hypothetical protein